MRINVPIRDDELIELCEDIEGNADSNQRTEAVRQLLREVDAIRSLTDEDDPYAALQEVGEFYADRHMIGDEYSPHDEDVFLLPKDLEEIVDPQKAVTRPLNPEHVHGSDAMPSGNDDAAAVVAGMAVYETVENDSGKRYSDSITASDVEHSVVRRLTRRYKTYSSDQRFSNFNRMVMEQVDSREWGISRVEEVGRMYGSMSPVYESWLQRASVLARVEDDPDIDEVVEVIAEADEIKWYCAEMERRGEECVLEMMVGGIDYIPVEEGEVSGWSDVVEKVEMLEEELREIVEESSVERSVGDAMEVMTEEAEVVDDD